jgi:hypothetical protein
LDFYNASSLKQQSTDRHIASLGHIILILSQPVFALSLNEKINKGSLTMTIYVTKATQTSPLTDNRISGVMV